MANDKPTPNWRNFAVWSMVGALAYVLVVWSAMAYLRQDVMGVILRPTKVTAQLGLGLILSMAVTGFANWKRSVTLRTFRNFLIHNAVAVVAFMLVIWGFSALARTDGIGASEWAAAIAGATLIVVACLGILATAGAHAGADLVDDERAAEDLRERGRLILCSLVWIAACGTLLIILCLAGPGGVLTPAVALTGALVLAAVLTVLGIVAWRLSDELGRTLSYETGNMAFYLIWVVGGGWAVLAHLGFVAAPAPLDWVTTFTALLFAATFIVLGRRRLLRG